MILIEGNERQVLQEASWKCNFQLFLGNNDGPTGQPTADNLTNRQTKTPTDGH